MRNILLSCMGLMIVCGVSCRPTKNMSGIYWSKFAVGGSFVTKLELLSDSSFSYRTRGDMIFDTSNGRYAIEGKYLVLYHEPFKPDSVEVKKYGKEIVLSSYGLSINNHLAAPEKYLIKSDKLFICDQSGKVERRKYGRSRHKRFFIFGNNWFQMRYYLKRADAISIDK